MEKCVLLCKKNWPTFPNQGDIDIYLPDTHRDTQIDVKLDYIDTYTHILIYTYIYIYNHHHVVPQVRISLTLPRHSSLSSIAFGRSSRQHPVSVQKSCRLVKAEHQTSARSSEVIHRRMSLTTPPLNSPAVSCVSCSPDGNGFRDWG